MRSFIGPMILDVLAHECADNLRGWAILRPAELYETVP
jgi:hypothetical protein